jgi:hypothetical protein
MHQLEKSGEESTVEYIIQYNHIILSISTFIFLLSKPACNDFSLVKRHIGFRIAKVKHHV